MIVCRILSKTLIQASFSKLKARRSLLLIALSSRGLASSYTNFLCWGVQRAHKTTFTSNGPRSPIWWHSQQGRNSTWLVCAISRLRVASEVLWRSWTTIRKGLWCRAHAITVTSSRASQPFLVIDKSARSKCSTNRDLIMHPYSHLKCVVLF